MERVFLICCGVSGFLSVALGAFGAHGLKSRLSGLADGAQRLGYWETAASYHLAHSLALLLSAYLVARSPGAAGPAQASGYCFLGGIVVFSGSLYVMGLSGIRWLGAITPLGGLSLLAGWACAVWAAARVA